MLRKLDSKQKNLLFWAAVLVLVYVAYICSFKPTLQAMLLHHQLESDNRAESFSESSFAQTAHQNQFYQEVLKGYRIKAADYENRIWQSLSGMALNKGVDIGFTPNLQATAPDTTALNKGIITQQFNFKGSYFGLVKLLDTLGRTTGVGKVADLKLSAKTAQQPDAKTGRLYLQVTLKGN
ncbi:hypothetical protein [Pedobacter rhizosphaerae]|uniref:Uncharacterized protein n=1 Tax=Pedobacter rhizosphaerae TaxID=390241 RepID=A0A1H9VGM1_9SPHI|nr:hypothetical protein [Pedobacter rhizosphaerae]SES20433.1 hypothetical protein SAMN04488023_14230 [Pedobacter rhizosphaerae]